jgi:hypothetical protein
MAKAKGLLKSEVLFVCALAVSPIYFQQQGNVIGFKNI